MNGFPLGPDGQISIVDQYFDLQESRLSWQNVTKTRQKCLSRIAPDYSVGSRALWNRLKFSQKLAILWFLYRNGKLDPPMPDPDSWEISKAKKRELLNEKFKELPAKQVLLDFLQKAPVSAIERSLEILERLEDDPRFRGSLEHEINHALTIEPLSPPKVPETRRIAVGYRDKGTLPVQGDKARRAAQEESFIDLRDVHPVLSGYLQDQFPRAVEGFFFDTNILKELMEEKETSPPGK